MSIKTDPRFWDCECEEDYFKVKGAGRCPKCKAYEQDAPDSRVSELKEHFGEAYNEPEDKALMQ